MKKIFICILSILFFSIEAQHSSHGHSGANDSGFFGHNSNAYLQNPKYWFQLGISADENENYKEAIDDFTKAINLDSTYSEAYNYRALTKCALNNYYGAITDFDYAIDLDPYYATAYNNRGAVHEELNMFDAAIRDYKIAVAYDPWNKRFKNNLHNAQEKITSR